MKNKWSFQSDAIKSIVNGFQDKDNGRFLLIMPTGGGKTLTAIRAVDNMIKKGIINEKNKCLWVTHLKSLKDQTISVRDNVENKDFINSFNFSDRLSDFLRIEMKKSASEIVESDHNKEYKFIIIDECHHSGAKSYDIFFNRRHLGILGLTATAKRLDNKVLNFDKPIYQITGAKLQDLGVITKPDLEDIQLGFEIGVSDLDSNQANQFNIKERNQKIIDRILHKRENSPDQYSKMIIYVNTINHAKDLWKEFNNSHGKLNKLYEFGAHYILGGDNNSLGINNTELLNQFRNAKSGIIINVDVLSEGFDDPSIDTIVMAVPTSSLIRYIQRIGRAIRNNPEKESSNPPTVLQFTDKLPNARYVINFGFLFADISDDLEPEIKRIDIKTIPNLFNKFYNSIIRYEIQKYIQENEYSLKPIDLSSINIKNARDLERTNLFLFWSIEDNPGEHKLLQKPDHVKNKWNGIFINKDMKEQFILVYNSLNNAILNKVSPTMFFDDIHPNFKEIEYLNHHTKQKNIYNAMKYAFDDISNKEKVERLKYIVFNQTGENDGFFARWINLIKYFIALFFGHKKIVKKI